MKKTYLDLTEKGSSKEDTYYAFHMNEVELGLIERLLAGASGPLADALKQTFIPFYPKMEAANPYLKKQIEQVSEIDNEIKKLKERQERILVIINAIQGSCPHVHVDGTSALLFKNQDSHHNYYNCSLCFAEIQE